MMDTLFNLAFSLWIGGWALVLAMLLALTSNTLLYHYTFHKKWRATFFAAILSTVLMLLVIMVGPMALPRSLTLMGLARALFLVVLVLVGGYAVVWQSRWGKRRSRALRSCAIVAVSWGLTGAILFGGWSSGPAFREYLFNLSLRARVPAGFSEVNVRRRARAMSLPWQEVSVPAVGGIKRLTADGNGVWVIGDAVVRIDNDGRDIRRWGEEEGLPSGYFRDFGVTKDSLWYVTWKSVSRLRRDSNRWEVRYKADEFSQIERFAATDDGVWLVVGALGLPKQDSRVDYGFLQFDSRSKRWRLQSKNYPTLGPALVNGETWIIDRPGYLQSSSQSKAAMGYRLRRYGPHGSKCEMLLIPSSVTGGLIATPFGLWAVWGRNEERPIPYAPRWGGVAMIDTAKGKCSQYVCTYAFDLSPDIADIVEKLPYLPVDSIIDWVCSAEQSVWFGCPRTYNFLQHHKPDSVLRYDVAKRRWTMFRGPVGPAAASSDGSEIWIAGQNSLYRCRLKDDTWQRAALPLPAEPLIAVAGSRVWVAAKDQSRVWSAKVK